MRNLVHLTYIPFNVTANKVIIIPFLLQICDQYLSDFTLVTYNNTLYP